MKVPANFPDRTSGQSVDPFPHETQPQRPHRPRPFKDDLNTPRARLSSYHGPCSIYLIVSAISVETIDFGGQTIRQFDTFSGSQRLGMSRMANHLLRRPLKRDDSKRLAASPHRHGDMCEWNVPNGYGARAEKSLGEWAVDNLLTTLLPS
jgi:hypothetical protein